MEEIKLSNNYDVEDFNEIKNRFICRMREYNINFLPKDMIALDIMINALLNKDLDRNNFVYVINANCGMGKSVLLEEYINYQIEKQGNNYGCTIAKERIEDINKLQSKYPESHYALYGFKKEDCSMGFSTYNPNRCRICKDYDCRIKKNTVDAKTYPIVTTTHQRIQLADGLPYLHPQLTDYTVFDDKNKPVELKRKDLFIDEGPQFYELDYITPISIEIFEKELAYTFQRQCKKKDKLIDYFTGYIELIKRIISDKNDEYFDGFINKENYKEFTKYEEQFKNNYYGNYFAECTNVLSVLKYGGKYSDNKIVFPTYRSLNKLPFNSIFIFDATASVTSTYSFNCKLIKVPETRLFNGVKIYWCKNNNLTKNYYREHEDFPLKISEVIKEKAQNHEKMLLVTFKDLESVYMELLSEEIKSGKIVVDHLSNTKGKNSYSDCTCIFLLYNLYKGDDYYYFAKRNEIPEDIADKVIFQTNKKLRTAMYIEEENDDHKLLSVCEPIDNFIMNDKTKDIVQELFRGVLRKYNTEEEFEGYLFNTDSRVAGAVMEFLPDAQLLEWKPFEEDAKSIQLEEFERAIEKEFKYAKPNHTISLIDFRNKYYIKERTFRKYQKLDTTKTLYEINNVKRKGNFLVKY